MHTSIYELLLTIIIVSLVVIAVCISYDTTPSLVLTTTNSLDIQVTDQPDKIPDISIPNDVREITKLSMFNLSVRKTNDGYSGLIRGATNSNPTFSYTYRIIIDNNGKVIELWRLPLNYDELRGCTYNYRGVYANGIEDPRLFIYKDEEWVIANCLGSAKQAHPCINTMCIFKISNPKETFRLLKAPDGIDPLQIQKNWAPFEWDNKLLCSYTLLPHEILEINVEDGTTQLLFTAGEKAIDIRQGHSLRGGAPPILIEHKYDNSRLTNYSGITNSELSVPDKINKDAPPNRFYLGIGHTRKPGSSDYYHFFYIFEAEPPFTILQMSKQFKMESANLIQFASGLSLHDDKVYVSYGVDDKSNRISCYNLDRLLSFVYANDKEFDEKVLPLNHWNFPPIEG